MTQTEPIQSTHQGRSRERTLSWAHAKRNVKQDIKEEIDPIKGEPDDIFKGWNYNWYNLKRTRPLYLHLLLLLYQQFQECRM